MPQSGFEAEYAAMKQAAVRIEESKDNLTEKKSSFGQDLSLSNAINYPLGGGSEEGPLTLLPKTFDSFTKSVYNPLVDNLDSYLSETASKLGSLVDNLRQAIAEYEQRDHSALDRLNTTQPPR